ncbi:sensor histidine kinase [Candidatus Poribacteria bacterium]
MADQAEDKEFGKERAICEEIADAISSTFHFFSESKLDLLYLWDIEQLFENTDSISDFWHSTGQVLDILQPWLHFDWCIALRRSKQQGNVAVFQPINTEGRGLRHPRRLAQESLEFPNTNINNVGELMPIPLAIAQQLSESIPEHSSMWAAPLARTSTDVPAIIIFGLIAKGKTRDVDTWLALTQSRLFKVAQWMGARHKELQAWDTVRAQNKELKLSEEALRKTVDKLNDSLLSLTHWLNRPILGLVGTLTMLKLKYKLINAEELIDIIDANTTTLEHVGLVCRGIAIAFSHGRDEGGAEFKPDRKKIDVKKELEKLCNAMELVSNRIDIGFEFYEFTGNESVMMDEESFIYVLYTLLDNAIKYSYEGSFISLICAEEEGKKVIKVKSKGRRILPSERTKVFEKFWRGKFATRGDESGLGIGCWAAKQHMLINGGDLTLEIYDDLSVFIVHPPEWV